MQKKNIFVFDIETIVDTNDAKKLLSLDENDPSKLREALRQYHLKITDGKNDFARQPFHKIVAISFLVAQIERDENGFEIYNLKEIRSGGSLESEEKELVDGFFRYLKNLSPRIVSYNGKTFDMPVIKLRAMKHGIQAKWFYQSGDKWANYNQKYATDWHCDLLDVFSDFGAAARMKMNEVCSVFGLPGKIDVEGSQVQELYDAGKLKEIRDYCELDVVNTYKLYLIYAHHSGLISDSGFEKAKSDLAKFMKTSGEGHFAKFLSES